MARSTYFYHQARCGRADKHAGLKQAITDIFNGANKRYGYRRVHAELRRQGRQVNHKLGLPGSWANWG